MDTSDEMKALMKQCRLTYADGAALVGGSVETIRGWLKPATSKAHRPAPAGVMALLRFLASCDFSVAPDEPARPPGSLIANRAKRPANSLGPEAVADIESRAQHGDYRDASDAVEAARRLLSKASTASILRILARAEVEVPITYAYRSGGGCEAFLSPDTPGPGLVQIEIIQEIVVPGRTYVEAAPVAFTFSVPHVLNNSTADGLVAECIKVDGHSPPREALPYLADAYSVMVAHVLLANGWQA